MYYLAYVTMLLFAASCGHAPQNDFKCTEALSPEDMLCRTTDKTKLRCYEKRAFQHSLEDKGTLFYNRSGWWNEVCIFQLPRRIDNFTNLYSCNVTGDLASVNCTPYDGGSDGFVLDCSFMFYFCAYLDASECLSNFPRELEENYLDGGKCGDDHWCPPKNLYSLTAFIVLDGDKPVFDNLTHLYIRLPNQCEPVNTLPNTFLAIGVAGIFIGIIYSLFKLRKFLERTKIDEQEPVVVGVKKILGDPRLSPEHAEQAACKETAHPIDLASSNRHDTDFTSCTEFTNHRLNARHVNVDNPSPDITFVLTTRASESDHPAIENPTYLATANMRSPLLPSYVNSEPRISIENGDPSSNLAIPRGYLRKPDIDADQD